MNKKPWVLVVVAALGYFVDVFDILLFSVIRTDSLKSIGVPEAELMSSGITIINAQMIGMIVGGALWGVWGDKKGRLSVLFGSILLYSMANILNAYVQTVDQYAVLRFLAGVGLAGELGAGVTLVAEALPARIRGIGTMIVSTVGVAGGLAAAIVGKMMFWSNAYLLAGGMGLLLLLMRVSVSESELFKKHIRTEKRGSLIRFFSSGNRAKRFFSIVAAGGPIYFVLGIVVTFAPEIGKAKGLDSLTAADAVFYSYIGFIAGDLMSGMLSQWMKSRKKVMALFSILGAIACGFFLNAKNIELSSAHVFYVFFGLFSGYWAVLVTVGAEQFGTNYRSTTSTMIPNLVRASTVPITLVMKKYIPEVGMLPVCFGALFVVTALSILGITQIEETFSKDMDFVE